MGNHVYFSRYLEILEQARGEFFRSIGFPLTMLQEQDVIFPVIEVRLRYLAPARYDDLLAIEIGVADLSKVKCSFAARILGGDGKVLVEGQTVHVCTSISEKPKRMPVELGAKLEEHRTQDLS